MLAGEGPRLQWRMRWEEWLALLNTNILEAKPSEMCRKYVVAVLAIGTFSGKSCWGLLQSRTLRIPVTPWLLVISLLFFCIPSQFSTSHFCWSLGGVKLKQVLCTVP